MENNMQSYLLNLAVVHAAMETGKVSRAGGPRESKPKDDFRKLMEESRRSEKPQEEPAQKPEAEGQSDEPVLHDEQELERQMSLAAMSVLCPAIQSRDMAEQLPQQLQTVQVSAAAQLQPEEAGKNASLLPQDQQVGKEQLAGADEGVVFEENNSAVPDSKPVLIERPTGDAAEKPQPKAQLVTEEGHEAEVKVLDGGQAAEQPVFRELEAVPVKVGDVPGAEQTGRPVTEQLSQRLDQAVKAGERRVELELEPRSLGKVSVELTLHQDGSLHVVLRADKPATQLLLDRGAGELQGLLGRDARQEVLVETTRYREEQPQVFDREPQHQEQDQNRNQNRQDDRHQSQGRDRDRNESFFQQLRLGLTPAVSL